MQYGLRITDYALPIQQQRNTMNTKRNRMMRGGWVIGMAGLLTMLLLLGMVSGQSVHAADPCDPLDHNCDGLINIVDLQYLANQIGVSGVPTALLQTVDTDGDRVVSAPELLPVVQPTWRTRATNSLSGPPRLGYAVDDQGRVFVRWALPMSPYSTTVEVLRSPAPPTAPNAGRPGVGIVATVSPIYDDPTALPLLGEHWETLRTAYTYTFDADGNPVTVTLNSVADMHTQIQAGANPFVGQQLANEAAGVARVLGRGYFDTDFTATGVYSYWVRVNGRVIGPLRVDTTQRTQLPAPTNVRAFEGALNVDGAPGTWEWQSEVRVAHAAIFLTWEPKLQRRQNHPEWHVGFNVFRKECNLNGNQCSDYVRVNPQPVFPRVLPAEATITETVTNSAAPGFQLKYGTEMHEFTYYWADHELNTDRLYCYRIAARDLLGQSGQASPEAKEACLRPPDYLPPQTPDILEVTPTYAGCNPTAINVKVGDQSSTGAVGYELWRSGRASNPWHPQFWAPVGEITPDVPRPDYQMQDDNNDAGFAEHDQFWYRLVAYDANGNRSAPSAPRVGTVDDICAPQPPRCPVPLPGQPAVCDRWILLDDDVVAINLYRKFGADTLPLLIDRIPVQEWDWATWQDEYIPPHETDFFYEIRAEDEVGNLSGASTPLTRKLGIGLGGELGTPIITGTTMFVAGGKFQARLSWAASGGSNLEAFYIYRSDGEERPASTVEMYQIDKVDAVAPAGESVAQSYEYVDSDDLQGNETYWYAVEAVGSFADAVASEPYAVRFVVLGAEGVRVIEPIPLATEMTSEGVLVQTATDRCCVIYLRSRDGIHDYTQISPILYSDRYLDTDVRDGDTAFYQALLIDAGAFTASGMNWGAKSGEIIGASPVVQAPIPPLPALPPPNPQAPPAQQPLPPNAPTELHFGPNWTVRVRSYDAGSTGADASGDGATLLEVAPGDQRQVWVQFDHLQVDPSGNVLTINAGGSAQVMINPAMTVDFPERLTYLMNNLTLNPNGATADLLLAQNRGGLTRWQMLAGGPGNPLPPLLTNVTISDMSLRWQHTVTPPAGNNCSQPATSLTHLFAVADSPLLVVPTAPFTWSEGGITFGATCTLYRERFSGLVSVGTPVDPDKVRDYRNDQLFQPSYTGPSATYSVTDGLNGAWSSTGEHTYHSAWPYGFKVTSASRSFAFTNGKLGQGVLTNGALAFDYATTINNIPTTRFNSTFSELTLGNGGAVYGFVTGDEVGWAAFSIDKPEYYLYIPSSIVATPPAVGWTAPKGNPASGVEGDGISNAGLNARERDLHWALCPTSTGASLQELTFPENNLSKLDLYIRRSGVSGRADMTPESEVVGSVSGYDTRFTRFAQSWLSNLSLASGIAGRIVLPYPADVEFNFASLLLDEAGCVDKGEVLPVPQTLAYWQVEMLPLAIDFRVASIGPNGPVEKLWVLGEYTINNLARVDGAASDPQVEIDVAFNPNGLFFESDIFVQDTVYYVDGFYTVMNNLRLSDYDVSQPANSENPAWDTQITIEKPPADIDGFVELTGGVYFPWFGEATDPNSDHIYLLPSGDYVGFDSRPEAAAEFSAQLPIQFAYDLAYAQAKEGGGVNSRWVGVARLEVWDFVVLDLPSSVVVEPQSQALFFGFPAVAGVMQAIDDAHNSWGPESAPVATRYANWRDELRISAAESPLDPTVFDDQVNDAVALLDGSIHPATYANLLDALDDALDQAIDNKSEQETSEEAVEAWLSDAGLSDETVEGRIPLLSDLMDDSPLQVRWMRGANFADNITDDAGRVIDVERTLLELDGYVKLFINNAAPTGSASQPVLLQASMEIDFDPQGSIYVGAQGIQASVLDNATTIDAELVLYFDDPSGLEGGLTLNNMATYFGSIEKAGAVAGFTIESGQIGLMYVGATLDLDLEFAVIGEINVGGSMLFGQLDPASPVLDDEYSDLFDDMDTSALAPGEKIKGAYMMVYANNIPFYRWGAGCAGFDIRGGGEVAFWLFTRESDNDVAWGTRLGVNANGEAFCVAALAAAITLQLDNDFGQNNLDLTGDAWAGAGCGSCEPEDWGTVAGFENDKWCLKCKIDMHFVIPLVGSTTKPEFDADFGCPF
jgi:hypothetical protein